MSFVGRVKLCNLEKGFGFITSTDGIDVFFHTSSCVDGAIPQKGDTVTFDCEENSHKPGQLQGKNISGGTGNKGITGGTPMTTTSSDVSAPGAGGAAPANVTVTGPMQGIVKNFNAEKGFGFIVGPDGSDIFLHIKAVVDGSIPQAGDTLTFNLEINPSKPGQLRAGNITGGTGTADTGKGKAGMGNIALNGENWIGGCSGFGPVDASNCGKGNSGPYAAHISGKGAGEADMMAAMMQMQMIGHPPINYASTENAFSVQGSFGTGEMACASGGGLAGKGEACKGEAGKGDSSCWGSKGESCMSGKGDCWGGKPDGWASGWGGKPDGWIGKGDVWGKGDPSCGKGDCWSKGDAWCGKAQGFKSEVGKGEGWMGKGDAWCGKGEGCQGEAIKGDWAGKGDGWGCKGEVPGGVKCELSKGEMVVNGVTYKVLQA